MNIEAVTRRIASAAAACGRDPTSVTLLAVVKAQPASRVAAAHAAGLRRFGENYLQEMVAHLPAAPDSEWHFIGRLQANKARAIAERFAWVHTLDRLEIAQRLSRRRPLDTLPLQVCLQLNLDDEPTKGGVTEAELSPLAAAVAALPRLALRGVMAIPRPTPDAASQRAAFARVRACFERLRVEHPALDTLSIGMSGDLDAAVAEGATLVRVGSALFGPRP